MMWKLVTSPRSSITTIRRLLAPFRGWLDRAYQLASSAVPADVPKRIELAELAGFDVRPALAEVGVLFRRDTRMHAMDAPKASMTLNGLLQGYRLRRWPAPIPARAANRERRTGATRNTRRTRPVFVWAIAVRERKRIRRVGRPGSNRRFVKQSRKPGLRPPVAGPTQSRPARRRRGHRSQCAPRRRIRCPTVRARRKSAAAACVSPASVAVIHEG